MSHVALMIWTIANDAGQWIAIAVLSFVVALQGIRVRVLEKRTGMRQGAHVVTLHDPPPPHPTVTEIMQQEVHRRGMRA